MVGVEAGAAGGGVTAEVEAVFEGDGDAEEGLVLCGIECCEGFRLFGQVGGVLGDVDVVAGVGVGVGEGVGGDLLGGDVVGGEALLELLNG